MVFGTTTTMLILLYCVFADGAPDDNEIKFDIKGRNISQLNPFNANRKTDLTLMDYFASNATGARVIEWYSYDEKLSSLPDVFKQRWNTGVFTKVSIS